MTDIISQSECYGYDPNGIRRVFGTGSTRDLAETRCREAAKDYVQRRRDTGPLDQWSFRYDACTIVNSAIHNIG